MTIKRPVRKTKRSNPETITKNIQKNINSFIGEFVGVYGPNIHFHGKLKESDDSEYDRSEGSAKEPYEYHIQIDDGRSHGYLSFNYKNVRKIILDQPNQQKIQIFIDLTKKV